MKEDGYFTPALFAFLTDLKANNDRDWFKASKARYDRVVREPMLNFIAGFQPRLQAISPSFEADPRPVGGSMFRIHRDTRFSKDKTPYKTVASAHFRHRSCGDVHAPGYYLHLEPGNCFFGAGLWHPGPEVADRVRAAIVSHPERWTAAVSAEPFRSTFSFEGETLKRPPRGYDPAHPLIEDLKRKDFVVLRPFAEKDVCTPDFIDRFSDTCRDAAPLMRFLTGALDLPW